MLLVRELGYYRRPRRPIGHLCYALHDHASNPGVIHSPAGRTARGFSFCLCDWKYVARATPSIRAMQEPAFFWTAKLVCFSPFHRAKNHANLYCFVGPSLTAFCLHSLKNTLS